MVRMKWGQSLRGWVLTESVCFRSVGGMKSSNLPFSYCHAACSESTITCVPVLTGSALAGNDGQNETTVLCQVLWEKIRSVSVSKGILIQYLRAVIPLKFQVEQFKTELPLYTIKQTLAMCSMSNIINDFI